jgi:hypothetical protein
VGFFYLLGGFQSSLKQGSIDKAADSSSILKRLWYYGT